MCSSDLLDAALEALAELDQELASVVELRFFAGLTYEEIGASLGVTERQVKRSWVMARAWLKRRLGRDSEFARESA